MGSKQVAAMVLLLVVGVTGLAYTLDMSLRGAARDPNTCPLLHPVQCRWLSFRHDIAAGLSCTDFCLEHSFALKASNKEDFPCELYDKETLQRECACLRAAYKNERAFLDHLGGEERGSCRSTFALVQRDLSLCYPQGMGRSAYTFNGCSGDVLTGIVVDDPGFDCTTLPNTPKDGSAGLADMCFSRKRFINDDRLACERIAFARLRNECLDAAD